MRSSCTAYLTAAAATLSIAIACGGGGNDNGSGGTGASGQNGGASGASGSGFLGSGGSNSGGTGNIDPVGGSSGSGTGGGTGPDACAGESHAGERVELDMFIMMDQSGSMVGAGGNPVVWGPIKTALTDFLQAAESAGIGVGIGYFPLRVPCVAPDPECCNFLGCDPFKSQCISTAYGTPNVAIGLLPGVAPQIVDSLNAAAPEGGTPTYPALQGAMQYALAHQVATPERKTIVVLATDGSPNDCNSNVGNVSDVARAGFANNPPIQTFVVGIGNTGNLNGIAQAGGTGQALIVNSANAGQSFLDAMNRIRGSALSCEFSIPQPDPGKVVDPNQVNVTFTPSGAPAADVIYKVPDAGSCDASVGGWYYSPDQTRILLCPASCDRVEGGPGRIDIQLHCPSIPIPG